MLLGYIVSTKRHKWQELCLQNDYLGNSKKEINSFLIRASSPVFSSRKALVQTTQFSSQELSVRGD